MTRKAFGAEALKEYEERELAFITAHASQVVGRGYIDTWTDLYPDLARSPSTAFDRGGVPLTLLLLLYERVALYIPPSSTNILEARWGMSTKTVLELAEAGLVQPIIGHPTDYASKHFESLFSLDPPSVWARGLGLLDALGMAEKLKEAAKVLPVSEISSLSWIREHWKPHFPTLSGRQLTAAIEREIQTLYADLWIFGSDHVAVALSQLKDPDEIARKLRLVNEVRTYPILFGLGGTTHYNADVVAKEPLLLEMGPPSVLPNEFALLAKGMGIDISSMSARGIIDFHSSDMGRSLRDALHAFENDIRNGSPDSIGQEALLGRVAALRERLVNASRVLSSPQDLRTMKDTERRVQGLLRFGGLALGALVARTLGAGWLAMLGPAGFGVMVVDRLLPESFRDVVTRKALGQRFSPAIANLWQALPKKK